MTGVDALLTKYSGVTASDSCIVAYSPDSRDSAAWIAVGLKQRGISPSLIAMRPLVDHEFAGRLNAVLPDPAELAGRLIVFTVEKDTMSHFGPLVEVLQRYGGERCMVVRIISASPHFFEKSLNLSPTELSARNASLLNRLLGVRDIRVRTRGGTDLRIGLDSNKFDWISNRGVWRPGGFTILPAGEIATYPARIDGVLVADGALNCNVITGIDTRLGENPLRVEIADGRAVGFECGDPDIRKLVGLCFRQPNGKNVGELGFGTNSGIDEFIAANSHINERRVGVHIGFGQHNQDQSKVDYLEKVHLDLITDGAEIFVDGDPEPIDLAALPLSTEPHPQIARDEDITGDCCGFGYGQLTEEGAR
ncbi:hypothetical protein ACQUSR_04470 [Streptomyces sp. P1-3]|uniref:hypothetical protein n=1 Tax=Streptomyces sp. P1-3 TaxID=3421658 RepID=UPI003D36E8A1